MKQVLQDLYFNLRNDRKSQVIAGLALTIIVLFGLLERKQSQTFAVRLPLDSQSRPAHQLRADGDELFNELATKLGSELSENRKSSEKNESEIAALRQDMVSFQQRMVDVIKKVMERDIAASYSPPAQKPEHSPIEPPLETEQPLSADPELGTVMEVFGELNTDNALPPRRPVDQVVARVSAGDRVRVRLDSGVNATADGTPYPVVFHLTSDVRGPSGSSLPLGEAYLVAAAQASPGDSRVLFRLVSLSVQLPNGERKEVDVDGWIAGEDGIRGMAGVTIDPLGKKIGGAILAGGIDGAGSALQASQYTTRSNINGSQQTFTGDFGLAMAGSAISASSHVWTDFIKKRMDLFQPHVQVLSGRDATAIFAQPFSIRGLFEALGDTPSTLEEFD